MTANVSAKLVFVTEENAINTSNFIINADDSSSDFVDLEFGSALGAKLRYDILNNKFVLSHDLKIQGNEDIVGDLFIRSDSDTDNVISFYNDNDSGVSPDVKFDEIGFLASEHSTIISIDSDDTVTNSKFSIMKDGDNTTDALEIFKVNESGKVVVTNEISAKGSNYENTWMKFDEHVHGNSLILGAGGLTALGSGESASSVKDNVLMSDENLHLSSDNGIRLMTNIQSGWDNRIEAVRILKNGKVGIGNALDATDKLHVDGDVRVTGGYKDSSNDIGTAGQILSSTGTGTDWISNKRIVTHSGRHYLNTDNSWRTWGSSSYGPNYYQWSSGCGGTADDPSCSWAAMGEWFPKGTIITGLSLRGRSNDAEVTDMEIAWEFRHPNPIGRWETGYDATNEDVEFEIYRNKFWANTTPGQPTFSGNLRDNHMRHFDVHYVTPEDGYIDYIFRPEGTLTARRYFYGSVTIEYILPTDL